jgi:hypothetical protein
LLRRLAAGFEYSPDGFGLDLAETARSVGLGDRSGQHSPFVRSINRTVQFGLAQVSGPEELSVRRRLPPLNRAQLLRLSPALQARHAAWRAEHMVNFTRLVSPVADKIHEPTAIGWTGQASRDQPSHHCLNRL